MLGDRFFEPFRRSQVVWITFSSSGDAAIKVCIQYLSCGLIFIQPSITLNCSNNIEQYYNWTQPCPRNATEGFCNLPGNGVDALNTQDTLLNWASITILFATFPLMWVLSRGGIVIWGAVLASATMCTLACLLRLTPTLVQIAWPRTNYVTSQGAVFWLHAGGIINGIAMTAFTPVVSELVAMWFPPRQRTTATAIAFSAYYVGESVAFLAGFCDDIPLILTSELVVSLLLTVMWVFVPRQPKEPPSRSAAKKHHQRSEGQGKGVAASCGAMGSGVLILCKKFSIWLLLLSGSFGA